MSALYVGENWSRMCDECCGADAASPEDHAARDLALAKRALEAAAQAISATNHYETISRHQAEKLIRAIDPATLLKTLEGP